MACMVGRKNKGIQNQRNHFSKACFFYQPLSFKSLICWLNLYSRISAIDAGKRGPNGHWGGLEGRIRIELPKAKGTITQAVRTRERES